MPQSGYYNWFCVANSLARIVKSATATKPVQLRHIKPNVQPSKKSVSSKHGSKRHPSVSQESTDKNSLAQQTQVETIAVLTEELEVSPPSCIPESTRPLGSTVARDIPTIQQPRTSAVPSSKIARLFHYGG
jgi:hypothetical protein